MTKTQALYEFFNSFGIVAYPSTSVPETTEFPWITYENIVGNKGDTNIAIAVNIWYHTESDAIPNAKAEEIAQAIGLGGKVIAYDDGLIWIKRGLPWCTALADENDPSIRRRYLNIILDFM